MVRDYAMVQAAILRTNWEDNDFDKLCNLVAGITNMEEAHDLIIALTVTGNLPVNTLRNMLA